MVHLAMLDQVLLLIQVVLVEVLVQTEQLEPQDLQIQVHQVVHQDHLDLQVQVVQLVSLELLKQVVQVAHLVHQVQLVQLVQ